MNVIEKISDRVVNHNDTTWNMNINNFDWVPGVGLYGIYKAYEKTNQQRYLDFLIKWADRHLNEAEEDRTINSTAPLLTIYELYCLTGKTAYLDACILGAEYLLNDAPLTREGGLEHTVTEDVEGFSEQIWADTLFMACIFLAKCGKIDKKYADFAVKQLRIHNELLFDEERELYFHGWNCAAKNHMSGVYWGRANAWIIYSNMEILNIAGEFDDRVIIEEYVKKHIDGLCKVQADEGGFHTVLNDADSYVEVSATAGIAAGAKLAADAGIASEKAINIYNSAINIVKDAVDGDGLVQGVSSGTPVMKDTDEYKSIRIQPTLYGQGLAIIALGIS